ncbi:MAG: DUF1508 domain-containing protein [bacterium]
MNEIFTDYPWMIYVIIVGVILFLIVLIMIFKGAKTSNNKNNIEETKVTEEEKQEETKVIEEMKQEETKVVEEEKQEETKVVKEMKQEETKVTEETKPTTVKKTETETTIKKSKDTEDKEMATTKKVVKTTTPKKSTTKNSSEVKTKSTVQGKYEIFEVEGTDSFKYILKASNGQKLIESDLFASKENVKNAIEAIKRNIETGKYDITRDKNDMYQFKLTASNNRPIAVSANYVSKQNAEKALESFKRFAAGSVVVEIEEPKDSLVEEITIVKEELQVNGKIIISNDDSWTFRLHANNGELLCTSKPYSSKANCEEGVETFKTSVVDGSFVVIRDKNKLYQFKLQTASKRLVVMGQTYEDKQRAVSSAQSVASFVDSAKIVFE